MCSSQGVPIDTGRAVRILCSAGGGMITAVGGESIMDTGVMGIPTLPPHFTTTCPPAIVTLSGQWFMGAVACQCN